MPLVHLANGPLSAAGPTADLLLDDLVIDDRRKSDDARTISITTEEKADPSHFALLKVLGQGMRTVVCVFSNLLVKRVVWKSVFGSKDAWAGY